jgi:hypothetical protein
MPREGHMHDVFQVFFYLAQDHNVRVMFDPTYTFVDMCAFVEINRKSMYGYVKEVLPSDAPVPHGKEVNLQLCVDSDHAGDQFPRRSRTGCVKRHPTVESSVVGDEFVAMKNGIETILGLCYKSRIMGVPFSGPTYVYGATCLSFTTINALHLF